MPIGGTAVAFVDDDAFETTKDVDLVLLALRAGRRELPAFDDLVAAAKRLSDQVLPRGDHTSVALTLTIPEGPVLVEFILGRPKKRGGYFVTREVLTAVAQLATERDGLLDLPVEALAYLKAWAADDKARLAAAGKDEHGRHALRRDAFLNEVRALLPDSRRGKAADPAVFAPLLAAASPDRQAAIRKILAEAQWPLP